MDWAELTATSALGRVLAGQEKSATILRGVADVVELLGKYPKTALGLGAGAVGTGAVATKGAKTFKEEHQRAKMQGARPSVHKGGLY